MSFSDKVIADKGLPGTIHIYIPDANVPYNSSLNTMPYAVGGFINSKDVKKHLM